MNATTRRLLDGPIAPTLLALAVPNVVMLVAQVAINVLEGYFVGWLGTDALAGVSVTFPLIMLMQTMSAGGMGGGVASAGARALGGGRRAEADARVVHALVIAVIMAAVFSALPRLGIAGAAAASVASFSLGSLALLGYLLSGRSLVRPRGLRLRWPLFREI